MHRKNSAELTLAPPPAVRPLNAEPDPNVVGFPPPSEYAVAVDLPSPEDERLNEPELRELVNLVDAPCFAAVDDEPPLPLDEPRLEELE